MRALIGPGFGTEVTGELVRRADLDTHSAPVGCRPWAAYNNPTIDTRIFSEQISKLNVTQGNAIERLAADLRPGRCSWVTVGDLGLGTKVGTQMTTVGFLIDSADGSRGYAVLRHI